jgi:hypothetical protein
MIVWYASDGTTAWVSFPDEQVPMTDPITSPPPPSRWFVPPPRTIDAFNGEGKLVETLGTFTATSITTPPTSADGQAAGPDSSSSGSNVPWGWLAFAAAVVVGGGVVLSRHARRA